CASRRITRTSRVARTLPENGCRDWRLSDRTSSGNSSSRTAAGCCPTDPSSPMAQTIDIDDLTNPVLTPMQRAAVDAAEANPGPLDEQGVLDAARATANLWDFGADDFRPRLRLWLSETAADEDLTELGRVMIYQMAVNYAKNRLRVEDIVRRHPEILDIPI